jgi:hypothetical protein
MTTYEEWRVTGTLPSGTPYATPYESEAAARHLIARGRIVGWNDGPHLQRRTVTVTEWEQVDP